jgi:serine/threonine protein kinase
VDCAFCYYPNDDEARFCVRCAAPLGVPVERLPSAPPPAPRPEELATADAIAAGTAPGQVLGERYRLLRCLGSGGFGAVFEAEEIDTSLRVAVKLLNRTALLDGRMRERFLQEARMIAGLRSPHVVRLYDYALSGHLPYLVMELIAGRNLATLLMRGVLPARRTLQILAQVAEALGEAHALGIVHRDIKPDNILLVDIGRDAATRPSAGMEPGADFVKLIDFGVARLRGAATRPSDVLGTPAFISPETLANEEVDGRCDLYALGILLWQMILGELPFPSTNQAVMMNSHLSAPRRRPSELYPYLRGRLPQRLEELMVQLIARRPADRPKSAYDVRAELLSLLTLPPSQLSDAPLTSAPLPNFGPCWDAGPEPDPNQNEGSDAGHSAHHDRSHSDAVATRRQTAPAF